MPAKEPPPMLLARRLVLALGLLLLPVVAAAAPLTIRVGYAGIGPGGSRNVPGLAGVIAAERYLERAFEDDPAVAVEWFFFKGAGPAVNEALASGQLDFAFMGDLPSLSGRAAGLDTRILMGTNARDNLYLVAPPDSPIAGLADLKGRRVAQFRGTSTHLTTERVLTRAGLSSRDMRFVPMDDPTALAALVSRDVDAAFGKAVFLSLVVRGDAKVVYSSKGDPTAVASNHLLVTGSFASAHPDLVQRVVTASLRAAAWASDEVHREALFAIWAKSGTPVEVFRADYEGQALAYRLSPLIDDLFVANYREKAEQVRALGLVRRPVDVAGWFDTRFLDAALRSLGLDRAWTRYGADGRPHDS